MKCIIVDDEQMARVIIRTLCDKIKSIKVVDEFSNAMQAIKFLNANEIDLIFLDIHMPDFNGLDLIKTIKNPPKIILTTSDSEFALEAFEYGFIIDYLLKPVGFLRFQKAILKAQIHASTSSDIKLGLEIENDFYVNIDRRLVKIDLAGIYLVKAERDYIEIKTETGNYRVHSTLKKIEEKLPDSLFLKIHRSFIINIKKIIDIEDNSVLIKKDVIPVSRSKRPELMKRLDLL
ncbi:LytR/AlgR family response regulator transcription factor [Maribacter antarcticus]|uniref:LytR/AlgR family response regulator transcription factor n=1 Tax=Maribacter antarcticus TaxID=505250 RepID=UPI00047C6FF9|nr:LytTR family DNA-binding domain-containing protein [Maribacter antarcticus]